MKKTNLKLTLSGLILSLTTLSCSENGSNTKEKSVLKNTEAKIEVKTITETPKIASMTKSESITRLRQFIKKNTKKYVDYGEIEDIISTGGNYSDDRVLDYLFTVNFYPGGDYIHPTNFYYDSELDEFRELTLSTPLSLLNNINAKEIKPGKIIGTGELFDAFDGEHSAVRSVKAEFSINGSKIVCENSYLPKFKKAQKEIAKELEKTQQDLFDNADAYNSEAESE
jgi:hypothetical protein